MTTKSTEALKRYYQWFGERAYATHGIPGILNKPGITSCSGCGRTGRLHSSKGGYRAFCDVCVTVSGNYEGIKTPGRLGGGWAAILTADSVTLSTGIRKTWGAFRSLDNIKLFNNTVQKTLKNAIMYPPEPPFMVIAYTQSSADMCSQLRLTHSKEIIYINEQRLNAKHIRNSVSIITASDIPQAQLKNAASAYGTLARGLSGEKHISHSKEQINAAEKKYPGITAIIQSMPLIGTPEHNWTMVCAYEK
jgi:hypothetical protein